MRKTIFVLCTVFTWSCRDIDTAGIMEDENGNNDSLTSEGVDTEVTTEATWVDSDFAGNGGLDSEWTATDIEVPSPMAKSR